MFKKINTKDYESWSKDELIKEIVKIRSTTYGLVWHRDLPEEKIDILVNPDARTPNEMFPNEMAGKPFPVLDEVKSKAIKFDSTKLVNLLIEGDNYHSLAVLNFTHHEAIDMIYIDPPYNTGNSDFTYNDKIVDIEDAFRHSKWLSFMEKRLKLAKPLLKNSGLIFISIDDNEQAPLKMLCDEIFGESNFINCIVLKTKASSGASGGGEDKGLKKNKEYLLMYSKNSNDLDIQKQYLEVKLTDYIQERKEKNIGFYYTRILFSSGKEILLGEKDEMKIYEHKNFVFLTVNEVMKKEKLSEAEVYLKYFDKIFMVTNAQTSLPAKVIKFANGGKQKLLSYGYKPSSGRSKGNDVRKYIWNDTLVVWLKDSAAKKDNTIFKKIELGDLWSDISWGRLDLEGDVVFKNGKKPVALIERLLDMKRDDAIVLDFFAGSGTTGHAVLKANKKDGGRRQFILCTNNENKICEETTYPRLKNVIEGFNDKEAFGGNLKYFKTDFVEAEPTDKNKRKLVKESTEMLCIKENAYELVEEATDFVIFKNTDKYVGVIYYEEAIDEYKKSINKINGHFSTYIFSLGDDPHEKKFADVKEKVTLCAIPEVILKVYREIFK